MANSAAAHCAASAGRLRARAASASGGLGPGGRSPPRRGPQVPQHVLRRLVALGLVLDDHPLDDPGQIVRHALQHAADGRQWRSAAACHIIQAICLSRPKVPKPGKKRLELRPAHQLVGRKAQRIQVAGRPDRRRTGWTSSSGAMYLVVPFSRLPSSLLARRASPKSPSFTRPCASTSKLLGLMSP